MLRSREKIFGAGPRFITARFVGAKNNPAHVEFPAFGDETQHRSATANLNVVTMRTETEYTKRTVGFVEFQRKHTRWKDELNEFHFCRTVRDSQSLSLPRSSRRHM